MTFKQAEVKPKDNGSDLYYLRIAGCSQSFTNNEYNTVTGWTVPSGISSSEFDGSIWTCKFSGRYDIHCQMGLVSSNDNSDHFQIRIQKLPKGASSWEEWRMGRDNLHQVSTPTIDVGGTDDFVQGDKLRVLFYQDADSGGSRSAYNAAEATYWEIVEIPVSKPSADNAIIQRTTTKEMNSSNASEVNNSTLWTFSRIGNMVTMMANGDVTRSSSSNSVNSFDFVPIGYRPIANTSIVYAFNYAGAYDWMIFVYSSGRLIIYKRNVLTGATSSATTFPVTGLTWITNDP